MRVYKLIVLNRKVVNKWKPEGIYSSWFAKNLINKFIRNGNIERSEQFIYSGLKSLKFAYRYDPAEVLVLVVEHFRLRMGLKVYRRGRINILVPKLLTVPQSVRISLQTIKRFIIATPVSSDQPFSLLPFNLFNFLSRYMVGQIDYLATKRLIYRLALRNRRFLHFRW